MGQFRREGCVNITLMRLLKQIATLVFWFFLWSVIPASLVYPFALWMAKHTQISPGALAQSYACAIALLFFPTGFLIDFMYRLFILERRAKNT